MNIADICKTVSPYSKVENLHFLHTATDRYRAFIIKNYNSSNLSAALLQHPVLHTATDRYRAFIIKNYNSSNLSAALLQHPVLHTATDRYRAFIIKNYNSSNLSAALLQHPVLHTATDRYRAFIIKNYNSSNLSAAAILKNDLKYCDHAPRHTCHYHNCYVCLYRQDWKHAFATSYVCV